MKFGVREICDVVLKRKTGGYFGKLYLDKDMPVLYFDSLKTSSLEGASTTVYAQGGKGNPRLVAWDGDRTITFTMEDALISPESFSILSGAGFMDSDKDNPIYVHTTEEIQVKNNKLELSHVPSVAGKLYIMLKNEDGAAEYDDSHYELIQNKSIMSAQIPVPTSSQTELDKYKNAVSPDQIRDYVDGTDPDNPGSVMYVDYYVKSTQYVKQIDIEAGKFGGSYYLEASTLFRDQATGEDYPAHSQIILSSIRPRKYWPHFRLLKIKSFMMLVELLLKQKKKLKPMLLEDVLSILRPVISMKILLKSLQSVLLNKNDNRGDTNKYLPIFFVI